MAKVLISEKQIVSIEEFMENYVGKTYTWSDKLTHNKMVEYLLDKGISVPERMSFDRVRKEDFLNGNIVAVKDKTSKIIIYKNPRINLNTLLYELQSKENIRRMKKVRNEILKQLGYQEKATGIVNTEEDEQYTVEKGNRQKRLEKINPKKMARVYR